MLAASPFDAGGASASPARDQHDEENDDAPSASTAAPAGLTALCEACAHDDDIAPLLRLVFEAQEAAPEDDLEAVAEDGRRMTRILSSCLASVAERAGGQVRAACEAHAGSIADASAEVVAVGKGMSRVRRALAASNADVQASGGQLSRALRELRALAAVRGNLRSAGAALASARAVLEQCLEAGRLVDDEWPGGAGAGGGGGGGGQLHAALALLDALSRKELAALLAVLVAEGEGGGGGGGGTGVAATTADPWAIFSRIEGGGDGSSGAPAAGTTTAAPPNSKPPTPLPDGPALARAFAGLVADLRARIQARALAEFDAWLLAARAAAKEVGMAAVRAAARQRALEEDLADERRQVLRALSLCGGGVGESTTATTGTHPPTSIEALADRLAEAPFRLELLREAGAAAEAEAEAAAAVAAAGSGAGGGEAAPAGPRGIAALREAGLVGSMVGGGGAATGAAAAPPTPPPPNAQEQEEEEEETRSGLPLLTRTGPVIPDVASLRPGEPDAAVRLILARHRRRGELDAAAHARAAAAAVREDAGPGGALLRLDMRPLLRALHVHRALGPRALAQFRARYSEQRRLQAAADLQPPAGGSAAFLDSYQPFLAQVVGFFAIEAYVARVTDGLVAPGAAAALWGASQRSLKATLEGALGAVGGGGGSAAAADDAASAAARLLLVKDFVLLACQALERASPSYRAAQQVLELLAAGPCARYHWLLALDLEPRLKRAVATAAAPPPSSSSFSSSTDAVQEVRTPAQHRELALEMGLPVSLLAGCVGRSSGGGGGGDNAHDNDSLSLFLAAPSPQLPHAAPYTPAAPAILRLVRRFVSDSVQYLRGLCSDGELPPAAFAARDRALAAPLGRALAERLERAVGNGGGSEGSATASALRSAMRCAADAWALRLALDALDEHTAAAASPAWQQQQRRDEQGEDDDDNDQAERRRRLLMRRRRRRHAVAIAAAGVSESGGGGGGALSDGGGGGEGGALAAALRGAQEAAEAAVLRVLTMRVSQILREARRAAEWAPAAAVVGVVAGGGSGGGAGSSSWPDALVSFLRETMDAGASLLPPEVLASLVRRTLRAAAAALTDWLAAEPEAAAGAAGATAGGGGGGGGGAAGLMASFFSGGSSGASGGGFNLYAVERLAVELAAVRRHVLRWEAGEAGAIGGGSGGGAAPAATYSLLQPEHARQHLRGLCLELAEPEQLCALLLCGAERLGAVVGGGGGGGAGGEFEVALQRPLAIAGALERLRETPAQAKRHPQWPTRKAAEAMAKELRGRR
jgi:hypothetical protein